MKQGTTFSFTDDFELRGPVIPVRLTLSYTFAEKNHLHGLFAPLGLNYEGVAPYDIVFSSHSLPKVSRSKGFINSTATGWDTAGICSGQNGGLSAWGSPPK
jgi:hypothetical protein